MINIYKIGICGHLANGKNITDGQTVKTKIFYKEIGKIIGEDNITYIDTFKWIKNPFKLGLGCVRLLKECEQIIILPGKRGLIVFLNIFLKLNIFFKRKIHYIVIGGWLFDYVKDKKYLVKQLKKINTIHVETFSMIENLKTIGVNNVHYMPNFKKLKVAQLHEEEKKKEIPLKLCTFSRVIKEKGIELAIDAVEHINEHLGQTIFTLDIYGPIGDDYKEEFLKKMKVSKEYIQYKGIVPFDKTVDTIREYFLLLFPTYYIGEGFAGTLIDSFAAGVPVIASNWKYNEEIVKNGENGVVFELQKENDLINKLYYVIDNKENIMKMKSKCLKEYEKFDSTNVINNFLKIINYRRVEKDSMKLWI